MQVELPTLEVLCQDVLADEAAKYGSKKINELCKRIPSHLLEPILQSLLDSNHITDVALSMFLVPSRTNLVMNKFIKIKNSTLKQIGYSCPNLLSLNLSDCVRLSNTVVRSVLQGCPVLEELRLDRCHRVTDAAFDSNQSLFQPLVGCLSLRTISLQGCPQVAGSIVATLNKSCVRLKHLNFSQCNQLESFAIRQIFEHNRVRHLNLSFVDGVTDDIFLSFPSLSPCPDQSLSTSLSLSSDSNNSHNNNSYESNNDNYNNNRIGDNDHNDKNNSTNLSNPPSESSHENIEQLSDSLNKNNTRRKINYKNSSLRTLYLAKSKITDQSFYKITYLINIIEIHLQWCSGLTDKGIDCLVKSCLKLEVIDLKSCSITDLSIFSIAKNSVELKVLDLSWCSNITNFGVQGLLVKEFDRIPPPPPYVLSPLPRRRRILRRIPSSLMTSGLSCLLQPLIPSPISEERDINPRLLSSISPMISTSDVHDNGISNNDDDDSHHNNNNHNNSNHNDSSTYNSSSRNSNNNNISWYGNMHRSDYDTSATYHVNDHSNESMTIFDNVAEPVYVSKLETLSVVWCLQLTDGALLSLGRLTKLKTIDATGCTGISQESIKKQELIGINLKL